MDKVYLVLGRGNDCQILYYGVYKSIEEAGKLKKELIKKYPNAEDDFYIEEMVLEDYKPSNTEKCMICGKELNWGDLCILCIKESEIKKNSKKKRQQKR